SGANVLLLAPSAVFQDCGGVIGGPSGLVALGNELLQVIVVAHILMGWLFSVAALGGGAWRRFWITGLRQGIESVHCLVLDKKERPGICAGAHRTAVTKEFRRSSRYRARCPPLSCSPWVPYPRDQSRGLESSQSVGLYADSQRREASRRDNRSAPSAASGRT